MVGNYAFLEIDLEHHDLQRILAYGEGQKIILSSVEASCSYMTTRSPMEISLVDYFSHGSRIKFDLTFNNYSRCKLPLDNSHSSKLNLVSQNKGMFDFYAHLCMPFSKRPQAPTIKFKSKKKFLIIVITVKTTFHQNNISSKELFQMDE